MNAATSRVSRATIRVSRVVERPAELQRPGELTAKKLAELADELRRFDLEMFLRLGQDFDLVDEVHLEFERGLFSFVARYVEKVTPE